MGIFTWIKRIGFFFFVNFLMMITITFILRVTGLDVYLQNAVGGGYSGMMIMCLIWGMAGSFISLWMSKFSAKRAFKLKIVTEDDPQYGNLVTRVYGFAQNAGLTTMPEVGIYESPELNAFATGPTKSNSLVAVSSGLLRSMNKDEVDGVLAHEVAHIANGDMVTMCLIQGVVNSFVYFFAQIITNIISNALRGDGERRSGGFGMMGNYFIYMMVQTVLGFFAMIVVSYFSRRREFRADAGGAQYAGSGNMIAALQALQNMKNPVPRSKGQENYAALKISGVAGLLSTHPPLEKRIAALQNNY